MTKKPIEELTYAEAIVKAKQFIAEHKAIISKLVKRGEWPDASVLRTYNVIAKSPVSLTADQLRHIAGSNRRGAAKPPKRPKWKR